MESESDGAPSAHSQLEELKKRREVDQQVRMALMRLLDAPAFERLMNLRAANPELYAKAVSVVIQLYQSGSISGKLGEQQLLSILERLRAPQRETRIVRR